MKRFLIILTAFLIAASVFAGATKEAAPAGLSADPTGATITFWYQHSKDKDVAMKKMLDEFNATNQWKITVKGEYAGGYSDIYNKMIAAIAAKNPPDLVVAYQNNAASFQVSDALVDLNPYVKDAKYGLTDAEYKDFVEGFISQDISAQFNGMRLGFPPNRSVEVMYYNKDWLKKVGFADAPKTWDEFYAACKAATDPAKDVYGYAIDTDGSRVFTLVISRGGDIRAADGKGYLYNTPAMKDSMAFMRKLLKDGYGRKVAKAYDDQNDFGNGKVMFTISSTSGLTFYGQAVSAGKSGVFDWSIAAPPTSTGKPTLNLYGASVSVCKTTPQKQLAAWLFIKWFSEPKQQAAWTQVSAYFPVRKSAAPLLQDYLAKDQKFAAAWNLLNSTPLKSETPFAGYDLVRDIVSKAYNAILDGADIDATLAKLDVDANKLYKDSAP
jgi:multiple sugar transport system substrate-binding protein